MKLVANDIAVAAAVAVITLAVVLLQRFGPAPVQKYLGYVTRGVTAVVRAARHATAFAIHAVGAVIRSAASILSFTSNTVHAVAARVAPSPPAPAPVDPTKK